MNELTDTQWAYLAGLIDGEGCFFISKYQGKNNRTPQYTAQLIICMTCGDVVYRMAELTGAGKVFTQSKSDNEKTSDVYRWAVNAQQDLRIITNGILPYLIVKKAEAEVMLEFLSLPPAPMMGKGRSKPLFYVQQQDAYCERLHELKTRGKGLRADTPKPAPKPMHQSPQIGFCF